MAILGPGRDRPAATWPAAQRRTAKACFFVFPRGMPPLGGRGKKQAQPLREGDRGSCRPSGLISQSRVRWTRAHDRTDGDDDRRHRPPQRWKTAGSIGEKLTFVHQKRERWTGQAKRTRPHLRIRKRQRRLELFARMRREYARSRHAPRPNLITSPLRKGGAAQLTGRCQPRRSDGSWPAFGRQASVKKRPLRFN
ncbi:hypothetical protein ABIF70_005113 [Bradyrhizobium japonicum]